MIDYKTVEGHEIKPDQYYETRNGEKVYVIGVAKFDHVYPIIAENKYGYIYSCTSSGVCSNDKIVSSDQDLMRPWVEKEEKKVYKLSDMWVGWWRICATGTLQKCTSHYLTLENARSTLSSDEFGELIAITKADATECYEGEGLKENKQ